MNTRTTSQWTALPVLIAGAFMVVLDFFIVNVALPSMAADLHAADAALEWVVAGYGLTFAAFLIVAGRAGDRFGRRRVYVAGLALFTLASAACGLAPDTGTLLAARAVQGAAGAIVMPQVLSIIAATFRGEDYARALGIYGMALGLAAVGGQIVGGALVQSDVLGLGWRGCFLINIPIGLAALLAAPRRVPESRAPASGRVDLRSTLLLGDGLVALMLPLIEGRQHGWPLWTWISFAAADLVLAAFVMRQRRLARRGLEPLLDLRLLRERVVRIGLVTQLLLAAAQASFFVYLALYLQGGRGLRPLAAGLVFAIVAVGYVAASARAAALAERYGRAVIGAGGLTFAAGLGLLALVVARIGTGGSVLDLAPGLLLSGVGVGLVYTPATSIVMSRSEPSRAGVVSGAMATVQQVGYALGVALTGLIFFAHAGTDVGRAFELSLVQLALFPAALALVARLLPGASAARQELMAEA